MIIQESYNW